MMPITVWQLFGWTIAVVSGILLPFFTYSLVILLKDSMKFKLASDEWKRREEERYGPRFEVRFEACPNEKMVTIEGWSIDKPEQRLWRKGVDLPAWLNRSKIYPPR